MNRTATVYSVATLAVLFCLAAIGCSNKVDGPTPSPQEVEPQVVCNAQLDTTITLAGERFSPAPVESLTDDPKLSLPLVTLIRSAELDGTESTESSPTMLNKDPTDPNNTRVSWKNQEELSFLVDPDLSLENGIYDVEVKNPTGGTEMLASAFAVIPPPVLTSATPTPICTAQYENLITLEGEGFLKIGDTLPEVTIGENSFTPTSAEGCTDIPIEEGGLQLCTTLLVTVAIDALPTGAYVSETKCRQLR